MSSYSKIINVGSNAYSPVNNPLTYCLGQNIDQKFMHGSSSAVINGQQSKKCQEYLGDYCAANWDGFCEFASQNTNIDYPNNLGLCNQLFGDTACKRLNAGEILVRNTAAKKYLKSMGNCKRKFEPFDPNVPTSPLISYWVSDSCDYSSNCVPTYAVDPKTIEQDPVMNKILCKPIIALEILINIYNNMRREGTLSQLNGTRLGKFFNDVLLKHLQK